MKEKYDRLANVEIGKIQDLDYPSFWYNWDPSASLSVNFQFLLTALTISKVEFTTNVQIPKSDLHHKTYEIDSVIIKGPPVHIQFKLNQLLKSVVHKLETFTEGPEGHDTKLLELSQCKWFFRRWFYETKMDKNGLFHPSVQYTLRFNDDKFATLPYSLFTFSKNASDQMRLHHEIRWDFMDTILACLELQLDKLKFKKTDEIEKLLHKDADRENQLLQVWIALKEK